MPRRVTAAASIAFVTVLTSGLALVPGAPAEERRAPDHHVVRRVLPGGERIGSIHKPAGRVVRGPVSRTPPPRPESEEEDRQELTPLRDDAVFIPPEPVAETVAGPPGGGFLPEAPEAALITRDTKLTPPSGFSSTVNEPSVGSQGQGIFMTFNWYAAASTDNGSSFVYINPYTTFPASPAPFAAGFCCDQRVAQDASRNLIFWYLQYVRNDGANTNGVRIAVAHGQADLATNTWQIHDFTPADFGFPLGNWLDFPHLQVSSNYLYFTSNVFTVASNAFVGAVIGRIPLSALDGNTGFTLDTFVTGSFGSIAAVNGAASTMYFGSVVGTNTVKVLTWPEAPAAPTVTDVTGLASTTLGTYACTGPDALNPCTRANPRMQTGWITPTELGFMWTSAQNPPLRPYPYVRVALLDPVTLGVIAQPDIFNSSYAWLYPAVAVNARGHLGGAVDALGGILFPTVESIIRDDLSPDVTTSGWETAAVATSTNGTSGLWGDFNGATAHAGYPNTWLAVGHVQEGGSTNAFSRPRNFWLMRARDGPPPQTVSLAFDATGSAVGEAAGTATPAVVLTTSDGLPTLAPVTVGYSTADGTATSGSDYVAVGGATVTFPVGTASGATRTADVSILNDTHYEGDETFTVMLAGAVNATVGTPAVLTITITDDDAPPVVSFAGPSSAVSEASGSAMVAVTIVTSDGGPTVLPATVGYTTADGTALAGTDYVAAAGTIGFAAGAASGTMQTISVGIVNDTLDKPDRSFAIALTGAAQATVGAANVDTVMILDDDHVAALSISDVTVKEPASGTRSAVFTVTLLPTSSQTVTVNYASADGTAVAGSDYGPTSGTLTLPPGTSTATVTVAVNSDRVAEGDEIFFVDLSGATNARIADARGMATILDRSVPGDFDADGRVDILLRNVGPSPDAGAVLLWLMDGRNVRSASSLGAVGLDWQVQDVGDFNGDGKTDILWRQESTGLLYVWMMNGGDVIVGTGYPSSQADDRWRVAAVADFNGDGKADISTVMARQTSCGGRRPRARSSSG